MTKKYIKVKQFKYGDIKELNKYLEENAEKIAENGVIFFPEFVMVQLVEGFDPDNWTEIALQSARARMRELVVARLGAEEDRMNLTEMSAAAQIIKYSQNKAERDAQMSKAMETRQKVEQNAEHIKTVDRTLKNNAKVIEMIKKGQFVFEEHE